MSFVFICFLLSCAFPGIFGYTSVRDDATWIKNGDRIKNRFVTGVVNGIVDFDCSDTVNGAQVEGECLSKIDCTKSGGKVGGLCSLLGSCCLIEKTCHQTTYSKLSYFVPPKTIENDCPLNINIYSKDVCQIRLDFEKFNIAKPTNTIIEKDGESVSTSFQCNDDAFTVEKVGKDLGFQHLCGNNKGQHLYIPVVANTNQITLRFKIKARSNNANNLPQPEWRIKIRQLECKRSGYDQLNAPSKLMAMYNTLSSLKSKKKTKSDWELIAPPNCLQYYPNTTGVFESFNYDEGKGCYIGNLNYAVCFKKTPEIGGAKYTAEGKFKMNQNPNADLDKCHPKEPASHEISQDYIRIPEGCNSQNIFKDTYCGTDLTNQVITAKSFEPLFVGVHTDNFRSHYTGQEEDDYEEIGFRIRYELFHQN